MKTSFLALCLVAAFASSAASADAPQYTILDLGSLTPTGLSQGINISPDGDTVVGRAVGTGYQAFYWTTGTGMTALPNLAGRNYAIANAVNDAGIIVGASTTTSFGSGSLPVMWQNGVVTQLTVPAGQGVGQANAINSSGVIVGSVNSSLAQRAAIFGAGGTTIITATTANGSYMNYAYGINDAGLIIGSGTDPNNAAVNVGLVYDTNTGTMTSIGALPGMNSALAFAVSNSGYVVGSSMTNQGAGTPFIWSQANGMTAIPFVAGATQAGARDVNDNGWVVGTASTAFAIPYLYADGVSYTLDSLLPANSGWDFLTNTYASALGISNNGTIIGTAVLNGQVHAYAMSLVPEPGTYALMLVGLAAVGALKRRKG